MYKEFAPAKPNEIAEEFILEPGDSLYIPQYQYHKVDTIGPRILISIHFKNKPNQTLEKFKVTTNKQNKRPVWINWQPEKKQKPKSQARLMNKANWSKPYFNKL